MKNIPAPRNIVTSADHHDDLSVLRRAFSLPKIDYVDISHQTRLKQMMARWPLLAELAQPMFLNTQSKEQ